MKIRSIPNGDGEYLYIFAVNKSAPDSLYKIGFTTNMIERFRTYNTGENDDTKVLFYVDVKNGKFIEMLLKNKLKTKREIYHIKLDELINIIKKLLQINIQ